VGELFLEALGARSVALPRDQVHAWAEINDLDVAHTHLFYIESVGAQCMLGQAPRPRPRTPTLSLRQAPRIWYAGYTEWDPLLERSTYRSDLEAHPVRWGLGSLRARIPPVPRTTCRALAEAVNNPDEWAGQTFVAAAVSFPTFNGRSGRRYTTPRFEAAHRLRRNQQFLFGRFLEATAEGQEQAFLAAFPWLVPRLAEYRTRLQHGRSRAYRMCLEGRAADVAIGPAWDATVADPSVAGWLDARRRAGNADADADADEWAAITSHSPALEIELYQFECAHRPMRE